MSSLGCIGAIRVLLHWYKHTDGEAVRAFTMLELDGDRVAIFPNAQHGQYIGAAEVPPPSAALLRTAAGLIERFLDEP